MPVLLVRNREPNPTIFADGDVRVIWQRNGDEFGDDIQRVPESLMENPDFLRSVDVGTLEVLETSSPEVMEQIKASGEAYKARREQAAAEATSSLERRQDNDIVGLVCIGPDQRGNQGQCGAQVLMRSAKKNEIPPLCPRHQSLAPLFTLTESGSKGEGATPSRAGTVSREWRQAQVMPSH